MLYNHLVLVSLLLSLTSNMSYSRSRLSQKDISDISEFLEVDVSNWSFNDYFKITKEAEIHNNREYCRWDHWKREYVYDFPILKICEHHSDFNLIKKILQFIAGNEETSFYVEDIIKAFSKNKHLTERNQWCELMSCIV